MNPIHTYRFNHPFNLIFVRQVPCLICSWKFQLALGPWLDVCLFVDGRQGWCWVWCSCSSAGVGSSPPPPLRSQPASVQLAEARPASTSATNASSGRGCQQSTGPLTFTANGQLVQNTFTSNSQLGPFLASQQKVQLNLPLRYSWLRKS